MAGTPDRTTLNVLALEAGCGWGGPNGLFFSESFADGIVATPSGNQATAFQLARQNNRITVVASQNDAVKLPPATAGLEVILINHGANPCQVFGSGSDTINDVAGSVGVSMMQNSAVLYLCFSNGAWYTEGLANGFSSGFQTFSVATGLSAGPGTTQGSGPTLAAMQNFFSTVSVGNTACSLPAAKPGMEITVINQTATAVLAFPQSGESMNGTANASASVTNAGFSIFACGVSGSWWSK